MLNTNLNTQTDTHWETLWGWSITILDSCQMPSVCASQHSVIYSHSPLMELSAQAEKQAGQGPTAGSGSSHPRCASR